MKATYPDYFSKDEAAAKLGVSVKTLRRLVQQGKLRAVKHGRTSPLLFRQVDVARYLESALTPAPATEGKEPTP